LWKTKPLQPAVNTSSPFNSSSTSFVPGSVCASVRAKRQETFRSSVRYLNPLPRVFLRWPKSPSTWTSFSTSFHWARLKPATDRDLPLLLWNPLVISPPLSCLEPQSPSEHSASRERQLVRPGAQRGTRDTCVRWVFMILSHQVFLYRSNGRDTRKKPHDVRMVRSNTAQRTIPVRKNRSRKTGSRPSAVGLPSL